MPETIFLKGLAAEKNIFAGFSKSFRVSETPSRAVLRVTGRTWYRVRINGQFVCWGPARAAHRHTRVDEIDVTEFLRQGQNRISAEVAGHNAGGQDSTGESSFFWASLEAGGRELAATGEDWEGRLLSFRHSRVEAYSHARAFNEIYTLDESYTRWMDGDPAALPAHPLEIVSPPLTFLPRGVKPPFCALHKTFALAGIFDIGRSGGEPPLFFYEKPDELASLPERPACESAADRIEPFTGAWRAGQCGGDLRCGRSAALDYDLGTPRTGFLRLDFSVGQDSVIDLLHTEQLEDGLPSGRRDGCNDVIRLHARPGRYRFESFNPHFLRYLRIILRGGGEYTLHSLSLRAYEYDPAGSGWFECSDAALNGVYRAARETFLHNALDVFMDCPGRERGGWLQDAFWTGRAEKLLFGDTAVGRAMLENYAHHGTVSAEPGFPCCYPSDIGASMPTWSMFLLLQLEEYVRMSGDDSLTEAFEPLAARFFDGLSPYINGEGLLENPPGWIFVDWSLSNHAAFLTPVSTAVNVLFAASLSAAGRLLDRADWIRRGARVRETLTCFLSGPDGGGFTCGDDGFPALRASFFPDTLARDGDGRLMPGGLSSEACQYWCRWLGLGMDESVLERLFEEHGPAPVRRGTPLLAPADLITGWTVRLETLALENRHERLFAELAAVFAPMAGAGPGTLWEGLEGRASRCHGFASHAGVWLVRDLLGVGFPDPKERTVTISPHPCGRAWARGAVPLEGGAVSVHWRLSRNAFELTASVPAPYTLRYVFPRELLATPVWRVDGRMIPDEEKQRYLNLGF